MPKSGTGKEWKTLVAAGQWVWANRDRIRAAVQSEPVQEALKSPQARRLLNSPSLRQVLDSPQVRAAANNPEIQRWLAGVNNPHSTAAQPDAGTPGAYEPYTGETRRLA